MKNNAGAIILVFNNEEELALQLRAARDKDYPLHWDFSAAGGIKTGEDEKTAALRELYEEIGIQGNIDFIGEELYSLGGESAHLYIYQCKHNGPFQPNHKEVQEVRFFSLENIEKMIESGEKFHPEFLLLWERGLIATAHSR